MSTDVPGPRPVVVPASGRAVLAGWALGLAVAGPVLALGSWLGFRFGASPVTETGAELLAGLAALLVVPAVLTGFVLGLVALSRARSGAPGRGLAVAAVVTSAIQIAMVVVPFLFLFLIFGLGGFA